MSEQEIIQAKALVLDYFRAQQAAGSDGMPRVLDQFSGPGYRFRGVHPFNEIADATQTGRRVWQPLMQCFAPLQRRQDLFMAAPNRLDDSLWVTSMGQFLGLFDHDWLGIPATGKIVLIPYCEFHRVAGGAIAESALWIDIISVMRQAGLNPLPVQTGAGLTNPGPRTADGLMFDAQDPSESAKTLDLIMAMCDDLVGDGMESPQAALEKTWHSDMIWFGPCGIGATYTLARYQQQHQGPFNAGLKDIYFNGHVLEHAEGNYGAWFGWPNLRMRQGDGFLGLAASGKTSEMRVVDIYRRDGNRLAENWVFIDLLHYLKLLGVDVLARCGGVSCAARTGASR